MASIHPLIVVLVAHDAASGVAARCVTLDLDERAARARWAMQLDAALREERAGVIAVAEGLAAVALAYWIQLSPRSYLTCLRGAVLHAPASATVCAAAGLGTLPATRLPIPAIVVGRAGEDAARHLALADRWGARFVAEHQRAVAGDAAEARLLAVAQADPGALPAAPRIAGEVVPIRAAV
jgi:predicted alpha/beta hydrolase family esterase